MAYSIKFQMQATRTNWNKKALIVKYRQGLKLKVQDILILIKNTNSITDLIEQVIKINNRIFQREKTNKSSNKTIPVYRVP